MYDGIEGERVLIHVLMFSAAVMFCAEPVTVLSEGSAVTCMSQGRTWCLNLDGVFSEEGRDTEVWHARENLFCATAYEAQCVNADYFRHDSAPGQFVDVVSLSKESEATVVKGVARHLKKRYPNALFLSCLSGGITIKAIARNEGLTVHLGLLTTRHVIDQADTHFLLETFPLHMVKDHNGVIVLWDDIAQTLKTMAVFYRAVFQRAEEFDLPDDTKFVLAVNFLSSAKITKPALEGASAHERFVQKLVDLDLPEDAVDDLQQRRQAYEKWSKHVDAHVLQFLCGVDTGKALPILVSEGGNYLVKDKPDVRSFERHADVLLGAPESLDDGRFVDYSINSSLLWHLFDETRGDVGYIYVCEDGRVLRRGKNTIPAKDKTLVYVLRADDVMGKLPECLEAARRLCKDGVPVGALPDNLAVVYRWAEERKTMSGYGALDFLVCETPYVTRPSLLLPGVRTMVFRSEEVHVLYEGSCAA